MLGRLRAICSGEGVETKQRGESGICQYSRVTCEHPTLPGNYLSIIRKHNSLKKFNKDITNFHNTYSSLFLPSQPSSSNLLPIQSSSPTTHPKNPKPQTPKVRKSPNLQTCNKEQQVCSSRNPNHYIRKNFLPSSYSSQNQLRIRAPNFPTKPIRKN